MAIFLTGGMIKTGCFRHIALRVFPGALLFFFVPVTGAAGIGVPDEPIGRSDTGGIYITVPETLLLLDAVPQLPVRYNPIVAAGLSAVLPGGGQVYCSRKEEPARKAGLMIKGGLFLAANGVSAAVLANRISYYRFMDQIYAEDMLIRDYYLRSSAFLADSASATVFRTAYEEAALATDISRFDRRAARYVVYQAAGWSCGMYLFNVLDAVENSRFFHGDSRRNPLVAAWLSAVPALGLGQLYNGAVSKAGMIWMVQTMLLNMAYNNHSLMSDCAVQLRMFADNDNWRYGYRNDSGILPVTRWTERYDEAFRKRNLYLWYAIFFYFYGIFDAAVDAHLHDYSRGIRMSPAFDAGSGSAGFRVIMNFDF